ncbi:phosphopyruvate hydratase [candidate division WOR-3 bacterium]|uniref:Enolase n=1 Tax=candidate division WOR-3 bacterium TaxID=2052148 RepID=A0A937XGT2_UNCW3|nr:phosphopyruvate hydratase [candidate division WOR-3 bacterium]
MPAPLIADLEAREILDSRGNPTIEVDCILSDGTMGRASVPSGASTGKYEACELRDGDPKRFLGQGVLKAVRNVNSTIRRRLVGMIATNQYRIDQALIELDPTSNKGKLGANAILGTSLAVCRAASITAGICVYRFLGGAGTMVLPTPLLNVINGGAHSSNNLDVQEYMVVPAGFPTFHEALRAAAEIYRHLRMLLHAAGKPTSVGDEGGFAPMFRDHEEPLEYIERAVTKAGYRLGEQVFIALDPASSEFYSKGLYHFRTPKQHTLTSGELIDLYDTWTKKYPIISIEDGLAENDRAGWKKMTDRLGSRVQLVGDDIFVTNTNRLKQGIRDGIANAVLIKPNQVGTVSETLDCVKVATDSGYRTVISHRSGETSDHFIADLAVAANSGQIKTGAPCRSERVTKYNRLIRIEEDDVLRYAGMHTLKR